MKIFYINPKRVQRQQWGRKGLLKTNASQRLTYAYRCRLLKEKYSKAKIGIIIKEVPLLGKQIIKNEFDFLLIPIQFKILVSSFNLKSKSQLYIALKGIGGGALPEVEAAV